MNLPSYWIVTGIVCSACILAPLAAGQETAPDEEATSSSWGWWGDGDDAQSDQPAAEGEDRPWMITSPFANVSWPEIKMPRIDFRPPWTAGDEQGEGGWISTPVARARQATRGAIDRTRSAWNSAVDRMKFALPGGGGTAPPQVATTESKAGFWQRVFGDDQPNEEPSSVGDLMAKESDSTSPRVRR